MLNLNSNQLYKTIIYFSFNKYTVIYNLLILLNIVKNIPDPYNFILKKIILLFILLLMIAEVAKWWLNSSLYVFHGNYWTKQIYRDYPGNWTSYCYFLKPIVYDLNLYQNDDILLTYSATVLNGPKVSILTPKLVTALVKIDSKSGKTIWAKQISYLLNIYIHIK